MYIPNEIKDLIHKYVLAIEHPVVKGLKDVRQKYWTDFYDKYLFYDKGHLRYRKTISFYYGSDARCGYQVNIPGSKVTGPYCYQCGSIIEVEDTYSRYEISYLLEHKLCRCDYRKKSHTSKKIVNR